MNPAGTTDIHNNSGFIILDTEVWRRSTDEFEGCCVVDGEHGFPLFVGHLS